jgi:signal peptidase II
MLFIILAITIFISDTLIKDYIEKNKKYAKEEEILNGHIIINKYHNKGGMLNLLEKKKEWIIAFSSILFGALLIIFGMLIPKRGNHILKLGLSLTIGGAASNVYDRITKGYVVDYFSFKKLKRIVFNISDFAIFIGSFLIVVAAILKKDK